MGQDTAGGYNQPAMLQDPCQRAYTNAKMRRLGFAAFRECIALEQRRLLMQPYRTDDRRPSLLVAKRSPAGTVRR